MLSGQELTLELEGSLGELLKTQPGVAERSFGPGPSRPVIRGLDGDRVLVLENGQRTDDLSSQSADHGVTINPLAAERIEVVRGPATLLYGANAIGGARQRRHRHHPDEARVERTTGEAQASFGTGGRGSGRRRRRLDRQRTVRAARRRQRASLGRREHAARRHRELAVAERLRPRRLRVHHR